MRLLSDGCISRPQGEVGERNGEGGFRSYGSAQCDADVVPARNDQRGGVSCREIEGLLRLCDARGRLEPDSQDDFISVGEASVYPSVVVGCGRAMTVRDKVVVVAPPAAGSGESGSELYSFDTRYGKIR